MSFKICTVIIYFSINLISAQITNAMETFALPISLNESSGILFYNSKIITHNDSGNLNQLYELDLNTQTVTRTVTITNASNTDWEDIAQDDTHIYVGDFGNNNGNRTDLKIYKISKSDYNASTSVTAEIINFNYANQLDFTSSPNTNPWDAEALLSLNANTLLIISKNWVDGISNAYAVPKTPGTYSLSPLPTALNSGGLITGATCNTFSGIVYLTGYTDSLQPFIWTCENFSGNDVFSGTNTFTSLNSTFGFEQVEAISFINENSYYMTSEAFSVMRFSITVSDYAKLMSFQTNDIALSLPENPDFKTHLYPNPVRDTLYVKGAKINSIAIFDATASLLYTGTKHTVSMDGFAQGVYFVKLYLANGQVTVLPILKL